MKLLKLVTILAISLASQMGFAQTNIHDGMTEADFTHPPEMYSRETIEKWINEAKQNLRPNLPVRVMSTAEWSNYMNFHHFTPLDADPHHADIHGTAAYDYNWSEDTYADKGLPTAEVTETGEFNFWWNRCNFKKMSEEKCKWFINLVVNHEGRHHDQWKEVALRVINRKNITVRAQDGTPYFPSTLKDLESHPEAKAEFLKIWSDPAHYQCREVEVYSIQFLNGEFPSFLYAERIPYMTWYAEKCEASKWSSDFQPHLQRAKEIAKWWDAIKPREQKKE